ncbi:lipase family protein [Pseudomonas gingeri]|nr:lipase family protein [Pseudomonas gingeri]NWA03808.1 lipase family protein [Pseudomonas gingeri]NWA58795.1 lipase family protein [Pseudomonas gingeri]NWA94439.1 lipase family protein [Pseudomonas gingeri]NWB01095.1 lipase family protein [Pseudomonas gingeri]NWB26278.1 lipase family protein [Pseudomonas gingeri]
MSTHNDRILRTDTICTVQEVICGPQIKHWIEFQLLDEQGEPLANLPWRAVNDATRAACAPECSGESDAEGVIRIEGLHPIPITLQLAANPLAEQLQTRRLRAERAEPPLPGFGDRTPLYGPQRAGFSPIEQQARAAGYGYHYLRIGQLCDQLPTLDPPLVDPDHPPAFHFPDTTYSGFTVSDEGLDRRHVLEICPLRAWSLVLHHQAEYSLANAHNLSLMSILAYSRLPEEQRGSVEEFFEQQCLDLSRTPLLWENGRSAPCLVTDVPFSGRYTTVESLDTTQAEPPEGDTQLFYAISASQVLVAWRGTEMAFPFTDLATDVTFRPVKPEVAANCEPKVPCPDLTPQGRVHLGFREAFELARRIYTADLGETIPKEAFDKPLFICGHSLGGALGLIHAAALKDKNPLLYTYGMPRTFTLKAIQSLSEIKHFRHVNDTDTIPSVPPEAELDNYLYNLYGPLGTTLGFTWSLLQLATSPLFKHDDPYGHHGEIAMFFKTDQHRQSQGSHYPAYRNKDGLGAPYHTTISYRLPEVAKLYLVPSLSEEDNQKVKQAQGDFTQSLTSESRRTFFPPYGNPKAGGLMGIGNHFMGKYQPYIYGQLLESINAERDPLLGRQTQRQAFEQQMKEHAANTPEDQLARNRLFLDLQYQLGKALQMTEDAEGGVEALQRFNAVADPQAFYEKTYG